MNDRQHTEHGDAAQQGEDKTSDLEQATEQVIGLKRPSSRAARLSVIEEILMEHMVSSQSQLSRMLSERGFDVTQATLSRDLDEMNATKTRLKNGKIAYTVGSDPWDGQDSATERIDKQLSRGLSGLIISVASAQNMVVVHTPAGAAQYMASVIDRQPIEGILGTVAGDDTVLLVCMDNKTAKERSLWLLNVASHAGRGRKANGD